MLGFSILFCLVTILIERVLIFYGLTRGNTVVMAIFALAGNFLGQILGYKISFYIYELCILFIVVVGANRFDLMSTMNKGRWWWKRENTPKES
jgi:hypothetical protein